MAELVVTAPEYPFDASIHLLTPLPIDSEKEQIAELRAKLVEEQNDLLLEHQDWANDTQLLRFLIARNFNLKASFELITEALKWRSLRQPARVEQTVNWEERMSKESETGKISLPGLDKWGRSVVIFNNTVQNTDSVDDQMTFLAWNLELATRLNQPYADKYLVFMHLNNFSIFNNPPFRATKETIQMLSKCYPERLGHCICYQPPTYFKIFFETVKVFLDAKTAGKVVFIIGDVSEGSANDLKMKELIGDNWKVLTGAEQEVLSPGCSPGFSHSSYWPDLMSRLKTVQQKEQNQSSSNNEDSASI